MEDFEKRIAQLEEDLYETKAMLLDLASQCDVKVLSISWPSGKWPGAIGHGLSVKEMAKSHIESRRAK